jgi:DNA-binding NtrC family response regulator
MRNHRALLEGSSQHVLVLDNDLQMLVLVRQRLEREGYAITTSSNAWSVEMAIALLRPDVVLLDPLMSDSLWDGLPTLLRHHPADGDVPIILHTEAAATTLASATDVTGALGIIQKTRDALSFAFAFNGLLDHRREINASSYRDSKAPHADPHRSGSHAIDWKDAGPEDLTREISVRGKKP